MVEHQIICKILNTGNLNILLENGITTQEFPPDYEKEVQWLFDHYNKYGNVPDKLSFLEQFNDFEMITVSETDDYLVDKLLEKHLHSKQMKTANEWGKKLGDPDSRDAFTYLAQQVDDMRKIHQKKKRGVNLVKDNSRHVSFKARQKLNGVIGVPTGMDDLTTITKGWLKADLIIILARTNEGKTWLLLYFLVMAWAQGIPVLLYSGEMDEEVVGYRFDTIYANFSNDALMSGKENLGGDGVNRPDTEYEEYIKNLGTTETPFIVVTPKMLGQRLDIPTLQYLYETYQPGIVGIDQISLMEDYRKQRGEPLRTQYTHIAEDLYTFSEKNGVPVLAPAQANRGSESKKEDAERKPPETHEIMESDGIGQNATRVVALAVNGVTLTINVRKNRYGKKNQEVRYLWDIDRGILKPFNLPSGERKQIESSNGDTGTPVNTSGEELF